MSSSHVAVVAPDPRGDGGLGEPRQGARVDAAAPTAGDAGGSLAGMSVSAGDADMTMTEAVEEVAVDAEVKAAGAGGVASDPLYATESAGMVEGEDLNGARELDGGDSGEDKLEAEARVLQNETGKPVPAGDVATPEHAEAVSNKLEENYANTTCGMGNRGKDNGVAHCDKEMQNNVITVVDGSSKIQEDDGAPTPEQQHDRSILPICENVFGIGNNGCDETSSSANFDLCARYYLPPIDKGDFQVSDLVWGKVKSHPWWPGEIFDPSDASELALKHQKKGSHLVAYFGDNTFAWCDESQLKRFVANYSQMEKQSSSDAFVSSVNYALEELSRRILSGMSCSCLPEELSDNGMSYMVENAGLKDGVTCSAVNRSEILACFCPENLLNYIKSLALFPGQGGDLLELVIACSQLTSFYRSKGCPELASFQTGSAWVENGIDTCSTKDVMVEEVVTNVEHPPPDKPKRGRGRPRKQKPEDGLELIEKKATSNLSNDNSYGHPVERQRQMAMDFDDFDGLQSKKKRSLDSFEDSETKSITPTFGSSFKIGECIRRAASQLTGSSSIVKSQNEPMAHKNTAETENGDFDVSSDDAVNELTVEKRAKRRRMHKHHIADPKELLSQLCSVAAEPMNGYNFSAMIINYFSDYRNYVVSTTTEANIVEKRMAKRGRKRKVLPSPEVETTDHMQDSYWSGLSLHNHPIHDLRRDSTSMRPRRRRSSRETYHHSQQNLHHGPLSPKKQIQVIERSIIHVDEKMVDECKPTALVLSFGRSTVLPSETNLIKMFGRYGPLKESETEIQTSTSTVKVVFKKRADAEKAFSIAGKYSTFGPSLRSYRLVNMPFFLGSSETKNPDACSEFHGPDIPGPSESKVSPIVEALAGETGDGVTTSGALDQKTENEAAAEALAEEKTEGETLAEVHVEETTTAWKIVEDKEIAEEATEGEVHIEEITTAKLTVEDKEVAEEATEGETSAELHIEEITTAKVTVEDKEVAEEGTEGETTAEVYVEETTITEKTVEVKVLAEETTEGETAGGLHVEEIMTTEKTVDDNAVAEENTEGEPTVELHVEETATTEKNLEDNALSEETTDGEITAGLHIEKTLEDNALAEETTDGETTVGLHVEDIMITEKTVDDNALAEETKEGETTMELHVEDTTATEKSLEDNALSEETTDGETTVGLHVEETTTTEKTLEDNALAEEATEGENTVELHAEETATAEKNLEDNALSEETTNRESTAGLHIEETATTEKNLEDNVLSEETTDGETTAGLHIEETTTTEKTLDDNALAEETMGGLHIEETTTTEKTLDDNALAEETMGGETTVELHVEETATTEKTLEDIALSEETTDGETRAGLHIEETTTTEKTLEDNALAEETTDGETIAGLHVEEIMITEKTAVDNVLAEETTDGETTEGLHVEETMTTEKTIEQNAQAEETTDGETTAGLHVEEIIITEKTAEDNVLAEETTEGETTAELHVAETTTTEKTLEDNALAEETTDGETTVDLHTEETTAAVKDIDENALAEETTEGEITAEVHPEETTTNKKTVGGTAGAEETKGETAAEAHVEESITAGKNVEHTTVEAPDEKIKAVEDATVEEPDKNAMAAEIISEGATAESPDEKTMTAEKTVQDATLEEAGMKTAAVEETVECAAVEAPAGQAGATEQAG
ncbi:hypothetical protein GUJ93_ZPchr0010g10524 [Zizania palustris]|uniref:PWWP domain-containing protein n=1 Tax=Zizania palustris TaxID=103762 RepID=A0A8J6BD38_ZIZPA|nr:hypothetical protein GUJ93_ZPchr0010g10524 [Zizania palustris]